MKKIFIIAFAFSCTQAIGQSTAEYYEGTTGLSRFKLKTKLHEIVSKNATSWNYGQLPTFYETTDRDIFFENDGSLMDIYSENPIGPDPYNYTYEEPSLISGAGEEGLGWNREHIVSQSFFYSNYPMYSDLHFVVPTDARVNQRRSNLPFGKVGSSPTFVSLNGSKVGLSISSGYTLSVFEPIDEFKGDIARMVLYAGVRYESLLPYFAYDNSRCPFEERQEAAIKPWLLDQLIAWHIADPVSEKEIDRNNKIFEIQGNRNPFVDHPEWVNLIWDDYSDDDAPDVPMAFSVVNKGKSFIEINWPPNADADLMGYEVFINDTLASVVKQPTYAFHSLTPSTSYAIKIRSYDGKYNKSAFTSIVNIPTTATDTFSNNLYISKIIEGTENNKAIEITNNTGYTVDLRDYSLSKREVNSSSGSLYWNENAYQMNGYLPQGKKVVLVHPNWNLTCFDVENADFITAAPALLFDGKLAVRLSFKNSTIDLIGNSSSTTAFAVDVSLYRNDTILNPSTTFNIDEWTVNTLNFCEDLGNPIIIDTVPPTSVIENNSLESFKVYPNPIASGQRLHIEGAKLASVQNAIISDIYGRIILEINKPFASNQYIDLPQIPVGVYILRLDQKSVKFTVSE